MKPPVKLHPTVRKAFTRRSIQAVEKFFVTFSVTRSLNSCPSSKVEEEPVNLKPFRARISSEWGSDGAKLGRVNCRFVRQGRGTYWFFKFEEIGHENVARSTGFPVSSA